MNINPVLYQCDFKVYHDAAQAFLEGANPYKNPSLALPYVYPPITLFFFSFFGLFSFSKAIYAWALFKLICIAALFLIFYKSKHFKTLIFKPLSILIFFIAFQTPIFIDFYVGNITALECLLLWAGTLLLLEEKYIGFALCIGLVSQFKIFTSLFVFLPLVVFKKPGLRPTLFAIFSILFFASFNWLALGRFISDFLSNQNPFMEMGLANPSSLAFSRALTDWISEKYPSPLWHDFAWLGIVVFWGLQLFKFFKNKYSTNFERACAFFLIYALCLPRFKDYSYSILLPASLIAIHQLLKTKNIKILIPILVSVFLPTSIGILEKTFVTSVFNNFFPYIGLSLMTYFWFKQITLRKELDSQLPH